MKSITNKKVVFTALAPNKDFTKLVDEPVTTDYFKLIEEACNRPSDPSRGFTYDDIKSIDRVKKAIKGAKKEVFMLEDSDYEFVKRRLETYTWRVADVQFVELVDYVKNLK